MPLTTIFQVYLAAILMTPCRCIGGVNELEGLTQGGDGQLVSYLLLKIVSGLEADIQELRSRLELKAETGDVQYLKDQFAEFESRKRDQPKAVFAQMQLHGTHTYKAGNRVYFTSTVANVGNAYDTRHGYFEAPYDGTYLFAVTLCTANYNWIIFQIVHESKSLSEVISGDADWHTCGSTTAVTQMKSGSKVWVKIKNLYGGKVESIDGIPSFTGILLNSYKTP